MEKLALSKKNIMESAVDDPKHVKEAFESDESSECAKLSDLLLSCCWHSIKVNILFIQKPEVKFLCKVFKK